MQRILLQRSRVAGAWPVPLILMGILLSTFSVTLVSADPLKITGSDSCSECHGPEGEALQRSRHGLTFRELHRMKEAKEISAKLGIKRLKSESLCLQCHYTTQSIGGKEKTVEGVSCESCHGAARDWIEVHSDYGQGATRETESPAHKDLRMLQVSAAGMKQRSDLYDLAASCFKCHTVPNEKLVNVGGHKAGSAIELVSWLEGEVRHNLFYSDGQENTPIPLARRRVLFVVGAAVELEYALRGVAMSTKKADYAVAMAKRAKTAAGRVSGIYKVLKLPILKRMLSILAGVKLSLNNQAKLLVAADNLSKLTRQFAEQEDGSALGAIDKYLPSGKRYKGRVYQGGN